MIAQPPVLAVADGMGGHAWGEVASAMVTQALAELAALPVIDLHDLHSAIWRVNEAVYRRGMANQDGRRMGTTVTGVAMVTQHDGTEAPVVFNVGDSRTYRFRDGTVSQLTHDHSLVQELLDTGQISAQEAEHHPQRNVVTRVIGVEPTVEIDSAPIPYEIGDRLLICSDGLSGALTEAELATLIDGSDINSIAQTLTQAAYEAGATDNISVIVLELQSLASRNADLLETTLDRTTALPTVAFDAEIEDFTTADRTKPVPNSSLIEVPDAMRNQIPAATESAPIEALIVDANDLISDVPPADPAPDQEPAL